MTYVGNMTPNDVYVLATMSFFGILVIFAFFRMIVGWK